MRAGRRPVKVCRAGLAVIAAGQAPEPADPFQASLDDVSVPAEVGGGFDALTGDPGDHAAISDQFAAEPVVVA
ncbi:hypothetical protein Acsp02_95510 [Actinoplanes sp. NBRC 103695]|nr:hypothetical protein Acsp02_95510 [Actinoplanes sp. NBRC 103695]